MPPRLRMATTAAHIEADAEAAPFRPQHDHAGGGILVGALELARERKPHVHAERIELLGPIERDDADFAVGGIENGFSGHGAQAAATTSSGAIRATPLISTPRPARPARCSAGMMRPPGS